MSISNNKSIIICVLLLPLLVACSSNIFKNKDSNSDKEISQKKVWFSSPHEIAMGKYKTYKNAGMGHQSSLAMLRKYNPEYGYNSRRSKNLVMELDQNLNFYCFSYEKHKKFKNTKECKKYADGILRTCEVYNFGHYNNEILWCVKRKLGTL